MNQQPAPLLHDASHQGRCRRVEPLGQLGLALSPVHIRVSGTVHDDVHRLLFRHSAQGGLVRDVQAQGLQPLGLRDVGKDEAVAATGGDATYHAPQLSAGSGDEDIHTLPPSRSLYTKSMGASQSSGWCMSFSLRMASSRCTCQSMPSEASAMLMPASASGW